MPQSWGTFSGGYSAENPLRNTLTKLDIPPFFIGEKNKICMLFSQNWKSWMTATGITPQLHRHTCSHPAWAKAGKSGFHFFHVEGL
jgi:hypothetical protein